MGKRLKYKAIIYHIWYKEKSKENLSINNYIQENALKNKLSWCENGIDKYLIEAQRVSDVFRKMKFFDLL